jgi:uncharacterized membrane protein
MNVASLVTIIAILALSGCGQRTPPESRSGTPSAPAHAPPAESQADSEIVALGNEPFWNVRVTAKEIVYRDPEYQEGCRFPRVAAVQEGAARVFRTRREIHAGEPGPRALELRIWQVACSDGMSDREYSMSAMLKLDEETRTGCAYTAAVGEVRKGE